MVKTPVVGAFDVQMPNWYAFFQKDQLQYCFHVCGNLSLITGSVKDTILKEKYATVVGNEESTDWLIDWSGDLI